MAISDFKRLMVPGALVIGGVTAGSMLAPVAFAAAADDDAATAADTTETADQTDDTTGSDVDESDRDGRRGRDRHRHAHRMRAEIVTETLDMTPEELRAAFADGKSLADIAADQGVAVEDLEAALTEAATERIDEALADERIDADRAAELKADLEERIGEMITRTPGERADGPRSGRGHGARGFGGGEVAEFLGLTTDELRAALSEGQTLAEVAGAQGVSEDDLVAFLLDGVQERLDQAVERGRIDADDADEKLAGAEARIEEHINAEPGERPEGMDRPGRGHGYGRHGDGTKRGASGGVTSDSSLDL